MASWPETVELEVDELGEVLFCHGSPRSDEEIITKLTSDERLAEILDGIPHSVVVCGHTHSQFDRGHGSLRVVNAGAVGMPYEGRPGAYWALLGPDVELRRTGYDYAAAAERIRTTGFPEAHEHVHDLYVDPPTSEETAELFEARASTARQP
jgi:diadenosine tetraphosphatase ApaH/serine/threonine PP2A family protein phosphatase